MTTAPDEGFERSTIVRGGLGFAYGVGQAWLPGGYFVPSAQPQDFAFEFWRGAGQFTAGVVEVVAGAALVGGGGAAAGGGIAASVATGGASLLITAGGGSAVTAGWAAVGHGATSIVAGLATIADSLSMMSKGSGTSRRPSAEVRREADKQAIGPDGKQRCQHCGTEVTEKAGSQTSKEYDHRNPYSRSKDSSAGNIDVTCRTCNRQKGPRTPEEWGGPKPKEP